MQTGFTPTHKQITPRLRSYFKRDTTKAADVVTPDSLKTAAVTKDQDERVRWWLAISATATEFGDGNSVDPNKDITANVFDVQGASLQNQYLNKTFSPIAKSFGFDWTPCKGEDIQKCKVAHDFAVLVHDHLSKSAG